MDKITFQTSAEISQIKTMSDRGIRVQIDTPELKPEEAAILFGLKDTEGLCWVAFKSIPLQEKDLEIPEVIDKDVDTKSPSQRLRNVLYRYWEQNKKGLDFEMFYKRQIESFITRIKEKLI